MTARIASTAAAPAWQPAPGSPAGPAGPSVEGAWLAWPVTLESKGEEHTLPVPHAPGDPTPGHDRVAAALAALPKEHALAGARLERRISKQRFIERFRETEVLAIEQARATDPRVTKLMLQTSLAEYVNLASPVTQRGIVYLEHAGYLEAGRAEAILTVN